MGVIFHKPTWLEILLKHLKIFSADKQAALATWDRKFRISFATAITKVCKQGAKYLLWCLVSRTTPCKASITVSLQIYTKIIENICFELDRWKYVKQLPFVALELIQNFINRFFRILKWWQLLGIYVKCALRHFYLFGQRTF